MLFVVARRWSDGIFADIPSSADAVHGGNDRAQAAFGAVRQDLRRDDVS
jgi:hypothetical protein